MNLTGKLLVPPARAGNKRWYCGPYVMAAITGESFETIRRAINYQKQRPETTGVCSVMPWQLQDALYELGWKASLVHTPEKLKLKDLLKAEVLDPRCMYIIWITGHYIAVQGEDFIDTFTTHKVNKAYAPRQGKIVKEVYRIYKFR